MKIDRQITPETAVTELGRRIAQHRIKLGMTQAEMAKCAGVGKRTLERIEAGGDTQLTTLIRLLRVLELSAQLDQLIPESLPSPMEILRRQSKSRPRKRATSKSRAKPQLSITQPPKPWKWGDEQE